MQTVGSTGRPLQVAPGRREGTGLEPGGRGWLLLLSPPEKKDEIQSQSFVAAPTRPRLKLPTFFPEKFSMLARWTMETGEERRR